MKRFLFLILWFSANVNAMSGQALVADLNAKHLSNVAYCSNGTPSYYCSGNLIRAVDYSTFFKFWDYGSKATTLGSVVFTYIRSDIGTTTLNGNRKSGFILKDQTSALAEGKALSLRCIFPFPTESSDDRADHGCGFAPKVGQLNVDLANCAKLAVPATTAAAWLKNFKEHSSLPKNQCSLSTVVAAQFQASLEAHKLVDATSTAKPTEVLIKTWDKKKPEALPIAAVFYTASAPAKLADAQKFQRDYYLETSRYVPIVKMDLSAANKEIFSFDAKDQKFGQLVAEKLNGRYNDVSEQCAGEPAYVCNGVLVRTTKASSKYHAWDPSDLSVSRNGVAFSYLRRDIPMASLYRGETAGFVFKNSAAAEKAGSYPIPVRCSFPFDGATDGRFQSCGHHPYYPDAGESCLGIGVDTLAKWKIHYNSYNSQPIRQYQQCSLGPEKEQFSIFLKARDNFQYSVDLNKTNEVVVKVWPPEIPRKLPLEAFIYLNTSTGLAGAQYMQKDYFDETTDYLPVIRLTLAAGVFSFSYHESDQGVSSSGI